MTYADLLLLLCSLTIGAFVGGVIGIIAIALLLKFIAEPLFDWCGL